MLSIIQSVIGQEKCATVEQDLLNREKYSEMGLLSDFEAELQDKIHERRIRALSGRLEESEITLPVIVHVIHSGEPIGSGKNISYEQIQSQLDVINQDFRRLEGTRGFNDNPNGADIGIEFCLSPVNEDGGVMDEPGVHRYNGGKDGWTRAEIEGSLKPTTIFNPELFLNIWVVNFDDVEAGLLGYAQFPDNSGLQGLPDNGGSSTTDGVVVKYNWFGSTDVGDFSALQPTAKGRTLTHEIGHWLGLRHIWGDGDCSADDYCADTPTQNGPTSGCQIGKSTCGSLDMVENYMDYSDGSCMNIFTQDQKDRILAVMELSPRRNSLRQNSICVSGGDGPPVASFTSSPDSTLSNGTVSFKDLSSNFPDSWSWTFEGGVPNTSTAKNPEITYPNSGAYDVSLIATNEFGADTLILADYMKVLDEGVCNDLSNFKASYSNMTLKANEIGDYNGYLMGHNSAGFEGISEFFANPFRYSFISGVNMRFGYAYAAEDDASVKINVWNARGPQGAPGAIIEQKLVPIAQILEDIAHNRPTEIIFDRETPVFSAPFHVGIELEYEGDTVALVSSANGEAEKISTWKKQSASWDPFAIDLGINATASVEPIVGMQNSVQVSASRQVIGPGSEVILQARGASVFVWNSDDEEIDDYIGPQLKVRPSKTTTYTVTGSGQELCNDLASITVFVREVTGIEEQSFPTLSNIYPNPAVDVTNISWSDEYIGDLNISVFNTSGSRIIEIQSHKETFEWQKSIDTSCLETGIYFIRLSGGDHVIQHKLLKH
ncbi:MAG: T9SS type A sorting domain-containing protein [Cyclobacteriaceae bacterium]